MNKFITKTFKETQKIGEKLASDIGEGVIIALYGDLGSGKTTFVQGLAKGLGIEKRLISPTFIILRTYQIKIKDQKSKIGKFYHVDLYRIHNEDDIRGIGLDEIIKSGKDIVAIEWAEKLGDFLPKKRIDIHFETKDDVREITINKHE
jgi:tRNA threonylcarbamoyladenosine biosynthesis protein TsaE